MIDITTEQLRLLTRASADVPGRPHPSTLIRWALRGIRGTRLETVIVGGRRYTSVEAIHRFIARGSDGTRDDAARSDPHVDEILDRERL